MKSLNYFKVESKHKYWIKLISKVTASAQAKGKHISPMHSSTFYFWCRITIFLLGHLFGSPLFLEGRTCPTEEEFWREGHCPAPELGTYSPHPQASILLPDWRTQRTNTHCCGSDYSHWWGMINLSGMLKQNNNDKIKHFM